MEWSSYTALQYFSEVYEIYSAGVVLNTDENVGGFDILMNEVA